MNPIRLAVRNVFRNRRRTTITMMAIVTGSLALLLIGGFVSSIYFGMQTTIVRRDGHLHVMPTGYLEFGASRPTDYYIESWRELVALIDSRPALRERIRVVTPILRLNGIAGNFAADSSKSFAGVGQLPDAHNRMLDWDGFKLGVGDEPVPLTDADADAAVIGQGMAEMLNLCGALRLDRCVDAPKRALQLASNAADPTIEAVHVLAEADLPAGGTGGRGRPVIDLLAATANGAPNAVSVVVAGVAEQTQRQADDSYVAMHLTQAQRLVYGGADRVSSLVVQLHDGRDLEPVKHDLEALFRAAGQDLEVRSFDEINPMFSRVVAMFSLIFVFMAIVVGLVVLFMVVNTMTMNVMERVNEIGTLRALGVRRRGIRRQFLLEGLTLGVMGASLGLVLALSVAALVNGAGLTWLPPNNTAPQPLRILLLDSPPLILGVWLAMTVVAVVSSFFPARHAARLPVADALRHV